MPRKPKTKDTRLMKTKGTKDIATLMNDVVTGQAAGRAGAEEHFFTALKLLVQLFIMHEGSFPDALRAGVDALMNKQDSLRRDIPPEAWAALWPSLNALKHARAQALAQLAKATKVQPVAPPGGEHGGSKTEGGSEGGSETRSEGTAPAAGGGAGLLGVGGGRVEPRGEGPGIEGGAQ